jgi:8-oxo-dGTP pyrophosphatase MutT (NUDIX family)
MIKFHNRPNKFYTVIDENGKEKIVWESRSVAVNCVVIGVLETSIGKAKAFDPFVLVSKRGHNAADYQGKLNIVAGYLDWDENATEALLRESWEECGIDVIDFVKKNQILMYDLDQPWHVKTEPDENRQNISLRYGVAVTGKSLPTLSLEHNEVVGEVEEAWWMSVNNIDDYDWAFGHDKVIKEYLKKGKHLWPNIVKI